MSLRRTAVFSLSWFLLSIIVFSLAAYVMNMLEFTRLPRAIVVGVLAILCWLLTKYILGKIVYKDHNR